MSIDLGNNPVGSTPTDAQKTQLRSSIGLGSNDTVEFGEVATSQFNFPNLTTSEIDAVTDATEGDTYFDSDRGQFVRFTGPSSYDVISTTISVQQDSIEAGAAITLSEAKFFEAGLVPSTTNIFLPSDSISIFSDDAFGVGNSVQYLYNNGTGGVVTDVGWLDANNPFGGLVTAPVVVPNKFYRITTSSGVTSFSFNKILTSTTSPTEVLSTPLLGGSEYKIELTVFIGDMLSGNLDIDLNYTGLYDNSTIRLKVDDIKEKNQVAFLSGKLVENDTLTFNNTTKLGVDSPNLGLYTITMIVRPSSDGTFSTSVKQIVSSTSGLLLGKAETTVTKLV